MNELKTENLSCKRGENIVLKNINFSIKSGETLVVKGRNGSGKTTLLRILSNFITSYEGKVLFNDVGISDDNLYNSKFNLIGQKNSLKENLSIKKNLEFQQSFSTRFKLIFLNPFPCCAYMLFRWLDYLL